MFDPVLIGGQLDSKMRPINAHKNVRLPWMPQLARQVTNFLATQQTATRKSLGDLAPTNE